MNVTRLAKLGEERDIAILTSNALFTTPWHQVDFGRCSREEHVRYHEEKIKRYIALSNMRVWITVNPSGRALGALIYSREGMGDVEDDTIPGPRYPENADVGVIESSKIKITEWKAQVLKEVGPHFRAEFVVVGPHKQRCGVATGLCKILARESEVNAPPGWTTIPWFFETTTFALPLHKRFANQYGYRMKRHGDPVVLDEEKELLVYLVYFSKLPSMKQAPKVDRKSRGIRRASPEWDV